jgi:hypothetical protein
MVLATSGTYPYICQILKTGIQVLKVKQLELRSRHLKLVFETVPLLGHGHGQNRHHVSTLEL